MILDGLNIQSLSQSSSGTHKAQLLQHNGPSRQVQQTPFWRPLISQELGMLTKLQQAACTSYSKLRMPTTWSPWSQNAKQKRLMTGLPEKIRWFHSSIFGTQLSNSNMLSSSSLSTRGKLCSVCGLPDQGNPMILQFGPHQHARWAPV